MPKIKVPPDVTPAALNQTKCEAIDAHKSADVRLSDSWTIPPGGDGLEIYIAESGNLVLKQSPICADEMTVVLNLAEAGNLKRILPSAIAAARAHRKAAS